MRFPHYYLGGRLVRVSNEHDAHLRYTHVLMQGDRILCWLRSREDAEAALEDERERIWNEGHKLRLLYERRKTKTNLHPDEGTPVRLPGAELMYPTQQDLYNAVKSRWKNFKALHVEALEIKQ